MKNKNIVVFAVVIVVIILALSIFKILITISPIPAPVSAKATLLFCHNLENEIFVVSVDYGYSKKVEILTEIDKVCLSDNQVIIYEGNDSQSRLISAMKVDQDFCLEPEDGKIILNMNNTKDGNVLVTR